jgi:hypothetical protein
MTDRSKVEIHPGLTAEQQLAAEQFVAQHIKTPVELHDNYHKNTIKRWYEEFPRTHRPMWLRRTFETGSEFGAVVDYCTLTPQLEQRIYGSIMFDRDVEVVLPTEDQPEGGEVTSTRPYSLESLARAIQEVESATQPA